MIVHPTVVELVARERRTRLLAEAERRRLPRAVEATRASGDAAAGTPVRRRIRSARRVRARWRLT